MYFAGIYGERLGEIEADRSALRSRANQAAPAPERRVPKGIAKLAVWCTKLCENALFPEDRDTLLTSLIKQLDNPRLSGR